MAERAKEWRSKQPVKVPTKRIRRSEDERKAAEVEWIKRYRLTEHGLAWKRENERKCRENLSDGYVKSVIRGKRRSLSAKDIPPEVVELKRQQLLLDRLSVEVRNELKEMR